MKIVSDKITITFKAGASLADGDVVYVSAAGEVKKAATAEAAKVVGVADSPAAAGENVDVVNCGKKRVVADGPIAVGDRLVAAATAGRVAVENAGTSGSTGGGLAHNHDAGTLAVDDGTVAVTSAAANGDIISGNAGDTAITVDQLAAHSHSYEQGRVVGKALGSAAAVGDALDILVCLS